MAPVFDRPITGKLVRQEARLSPAHSVWLAGKREWPSAWFADLPREQVQIDQAVVLPHADGALIESHAVEAEERPRAGDKAGQLTNRFFAQSCNGAKLLEVLQREKLMIFLEAAGAGGDEALIGHAHQQEHSPDGIQ